VPNATIASRLLPELRQTLRDEVAVLPLYQWQRPFAWRRTTSGGFRPPAARLYDAVRLDGAPTVLPPPIGKPAPASRRAVAPSNVVAPHPGPEEGR